ncbi:hypothetical protein GJ496_002829 [Pomphorhynchus laevis]|nr:hypothetical protein GJ496_002829 [Pomphorhynchus laevis]
MTPDLQVKLTVKSGLQSLPTPLNDYEIVIPDEVDTNVAPSDNASCIPLNEHPDAEDLAREAMLSDAQSAQSMYEKCSNSVKRNLPVPSTHNPLILRPPAQDATDLQKAEELIKSEMLIMNHYDCLFGNYNRSRRGQTKSEIDEYLQKHPPEAFNEDELFEANRLLEMEMQNVKHGMDHGEISLETYTKVWEECYAQVMYLPAQNRFTRASLTSKKERIEALERKLELNRQHMNQTERKAREKEKKLKILLGGYQAKSQVLINGIQELIAQIDLATIENNTYAMLKNSEDIAIPKRLQAISDEVQRQVQREELLQTRYKQLIAKDKLPIDSIVDEEMQLSVA